jgi:hypothetical protein
MPERRDRAWSRVSLDMVVHDSQIQHQTGVNQGPNIKTLKTCWSNLLYMELSDYPSYD